MKHRLLPPAIAAALMGLCLSGTAVASVPEMKASSPETAAATAAKSSPAQKAWLRDFAQPLSRHTLCDSTGRQGFSERTCTILGQLAKQLAPQGEAITIKELKAQRGLWQALPMRVRRDLETYDAVIITRSDAAKAETDKSASAALR